MTVRYSPRFPKEGVHDYEMVWEQDGYGTGLVKGYGTWRCYGMLRHEPWNSKVQLHKQVEALLLFLKEESSQ